MSGFKFDKEGSDIDLSLGGDNGVPEGKKIPARKPPVTQQSTQNERVTPPKNEQPQKINQPSIPQRPTTLPQKPQQNVQPPQRTPVQQPVTQKRPIAQQPVAQFQTPVSQPEPTYQQPVRQTPQRPEIPLDEFSEPTRADDNQYNSYDDHVRAANAQRSENRYNSNNDYVESEPVITPKQQRRPLPKYEEEEDDEEEYVKPKRNSKSNKKRKSSPINEKRKDFRGGRKNVLFAKIGISTIIVILCFAGAKSLFFPTQFPSPTEVVSVVKQNLGVTNFPVEKASSFVINFTNTYLTYAPGQSGTDREKALSSFASETVLKAMPLRVGNATPEDAGTVVVEQSVISQPIITGVESIDDNNAVFTVQAKLSTGTTLLLSIPVYYEEKTDSMAVSAAASILPSLGLAKVPTENHQITWPNDETVVKAFKPDLERYLEAWANSDSDLVKRYLTTNATLDSKTGLNGEVAFSELKSLDVQLKVEDKDSNLREREALFTVEWADSKSTNITYTQSYLLNIIQQPDNKWYIQDITGVVTPKE